MSAADEPQPLAPAPPACVIWSLRYDARMGTEITYMNVVTLSIGLVGATLGILNTWHNFVDRRVRLKVLPKFGYEEAPCMFLMGQKWPTRLEPRQAALFYTVEGQQLPDIVERYPVAFAETECGTIKYGSSPVLKHIGKVKQIRSAQATSSAP